MKFRGKNLEDLVVTLSFQDGSSADYGVHKYFTFKEKEYFAMLPVNEKKELDHSKNASFMKCRKMLNITLLWFTLRMTGNTKKQRTTTQD